jgi:glycosyltransferase involved in cell wall biosynthesis
LLKDREIEFLLLLAGAGPDEQRLRREVEELSLTDRVRFLGEREDIPAVLAASDLFVLSSLWEGLPRSIMEAMAARLAVVSTDAGGVKELVVEGETGYVVPVGSAESLADRMGELLSDGPLRDGMGEAGYRRVREHFTDERMVRSIEAVYEEVLRFRAGDG